MPYTSTMLQRMLLAFFLALPVFVVVAAKNTEDGREYRLSVRMATSSEGLLQIFADTGNGFAEAQSYVLPLQSDGKPHEYPLRVPPGLYRMIRIDPGTSTGVYTIYDVTIANSRGEAVAIVPLADIKPLFDLRELERTASRLVVETTASAADPQLLWLPTRPVKLYERRQAASKAVGAFLMAWALVMACLWLCTPLARPFSRVGAPVIQLASRVAQVRPSAAIVSAAVCGVMLSAYPVLFLGRSLFSPNNGLNRLLYQNPPLTPGTSDRTIEEVRKSDVATATGMFLPFAQIQRESLGRLEVPLWNRYNAGGRPLWGQGYGFLFDPLHALALVVPNLSWGLDLKYLGHRLVFALGIGLAGYWLTRSWSAAAIVAGSVPFIGIYTYRLNHPQPFAMTYVPWVLIAWWQLSHCDSSTRRRALLLLTVATSLVIFASLPKEMVLCLLASSGAGVLMVLTARGSWGNKLWALSAALGGGILAILLTAPQWLVFADTLRQSETAYDRPYALFGTTPHALAFFLGPVTAGDVLPGFHALLLVALASTLCAPRRLLANRPVFACALVAVVLTAVAFGAIPERILIRVPLLASIGHVHDVCLTAAAPLLLVVSVFGIAMLLESSAWFAMSVALLTAAAAAALLGIELADPVPDRFETLASIPLLAAAVALPLALGGIVRARQTLVRPVAGGLGVILLLAPGGLHSETSLTSLNAMLFQPRPRVVYESSAPVLDLIHQASEPSRVAGVEWVLFGGSNGLYRVEGLGGGGDALQLPFYEHLADAAGMWRGWFYFLRLPPENVLRANPFLDMMNVRYLLIEPDTSVPGLTSRHIPDGDRLAVSERPTAWPRAFFVRGAQRYNTLPDFVAQLSRSHGPFASVERNDVQAIAEIGDLPAEATQPVAATDYHLTTNTTSFRIRAPARGVAVLTEAYLAGEFLVTLNGHQSGYFRVNHAFKGIIIPAAGEWAITVEYRPKHWTVSLALSATATALLIALGLTVVRAPTTKGTFRGASSVAGSQN